MVVEKRRQEDALVEWLEELDDEENRDTLDEGQGAQHDDFREQVRQDTQGDGAFTLVNRGLLHNLTCPVDAAEEHGEETDEEDDALHITALRRDDKILQRLVRAASLSRVL